MAQWLVTGGAGFIGSHLVEALVARGEQVRVLDNFRTGRWENLSAVRDRIEVIEGDVRDPLAVRQAIDGVGVVAHLAAIVSVEWSLQNPQETMDVNTKGTLNLLEAAHQTGVSRFLFASSAAVYGDHSELPLREDLPLRPLSPYAASKVAGEALCHAYWAAYGLPTVILRFFNVYGPRQDPHSPYSGVISIFVGRMRQGLPPMVYGDGLQTRDFVYVGDVVAALIRAGERDGAPGTVVNVAWGEETSVLRLFTLLNQALGTALEPEFAPPRAGEIRRSAGDPRRAQAVLGWQPTVGLTEGLSRLVRSVSRFTLQEAPMTERVEALKGRLQKGIEKSLAIFGSIRPGQWEVVLYEQPYPWTVRDLLAHLFSSEEGLRQLAQDIAAGGPGAPEGFDYDAYNKAEHRRLAGVPPEQLMADLKAARQRTLEWVATLTDEDLDRVGRHPALGEVNLETFINAIYGHQLMHMRDLMNALGG